MCVCIIKSISQKLCSKQNLKLCDWLTEYPPTGSVFLTATVLRFSLNDIFNISQHKNTNVSLVTQQYDMFILRPSVIIISPPIVRNKVVSVRLC